jgi:reverse gyrase
LIERNYVYRNKYKKLLPTNLGKIVFNYLNSRFFELVSEERTYKLEEEMKSVEKGKINYQSVLHEIYNELVKFRIYRKILR